MRTQSTARAADGMVELGDGPAVATSSGLSEMLTLLLQASQAPCASSLPVHPGHTPRPTTSRGPGGEVARRGAGRGSRELGETHVKWTRAGQETDALLTRGSELWGRTPGEQQPSSTGCRGLGWDSLPGVARALRGGHTDPRQQESKVGQAGGSGPQQVWEVRVTPWGPCWQ